MILDSLYKFLFAPIYKRIDETSTQLQEVIDAVAELKTKAASIIALVNMLADKIDSMKDDPAALAADIRAEAATINDAVNANTPVE